MSLSQRFGLIAFFCAGMLCAAPNWAAEAPIADKMDFSSLVDQFGRFFSEQQGMALVMVVNGMKAKNRVRDTLAGLNVDCLQRGRVIYLANISGMPRMISKLIAVPRLRDLGYPVWLDYSGQVTAGLPTRKDQVTLLTLDSQQLPGGVEYVASAEALRAGLLPFCSGVDAGRGD
ncbi:hypothetical protein [Porticoccus sp.]